MKTSAKLSRIAAAVALSVGLSTTAMAQVTSSELNGQILAPNGSPAVGTVIKVTHVPTGAVKTVTVNNGGTFSLHGLRVGGPYTIEIDSDEYADQTISDVYLELGESASIERSLENAADYENIVVTASQVSSLSFGQVGPSASFDLSTLEQAPAINRDITDIVRIDPRIYVDEGGSGGIQCVGKSPRFNSLTVDGVRMNDLFGLNSNGYPTERMPFSYDAIEGVSVEIAPFDVIYGGFSACNISAVSKTGTNEVHGTAFYDYGSDSLRGDSLEGDDIRLGSYTEKRYGFSVGAPLIEDTLFIFAAYEKLEGANTFDRGALGTGAINEVSITQEQLAQIQSVSQSLYNFDAGTTPLSMPNEDEKLLVKLDWNINDSHRFAFTYNYNDGNNFTESDGDSNEFELSSHLYERGAELESFVGVLYSDWTDKFSTEIRISRTELDNLQRSMYGNGSPGDNDFGEIKILFDMETEDEADDLTVYLGSDDSRQSNQLDWEALSLMFRGNYYFDNGHTLTFGYESDKLDIYNLFVQHSETSIEFESLEDFVNGTNAEIEYGYAYSGNLADRAAEWGYTAHSTYAQDEFYLTDDLKVVAGLRYDWITTSDKPVENAEFLAENNYSNTANLDGISLLQPRIGLNYTLSDDTELRGGIGLFSGGNPNVWMTNNYQNTNVTGGEVDNTYADLFDGSITWVNTEDGVTAGPGYSVPSDLDEAMSSGAGSNYESNNLDPDFEMPSEWKISAGMTHINEEDYVFNLDLLVSVTQDQAMIKYLGIEEVGISDEGYVQYERNGYGSLELTNSDEKSVSYSLTATMNKSWDNGISVVTGYNYSHAEDVQPMTSSVAFSNYNYRAFTNPNEDVSSLSDWNIEHRFTLDLRYTTSFFDGLDTTFSAFAVAQSGRPYSLVYGQGTGNSKFGYTPYLGSENGSVLPIGTERNDESSPWWTKVDIAVRQDIPAFHADHTAQVSFVIDNFTNMLNDDWGILEEASYNTVIVGSTNGTPRQGDASLWEMRVGVNYRF
ncbi:TonB-dependent receptor [Alteromonas australica]|uniref:TonB-dependent receptor n=1 Tax=Alteromonas australica TaxID=589873 RepID=UPI000C362E1A|nr:TonB-dependent receptor [Alteromonas australica]MBU35560.1 cell envelope biogenesis protein OmpA [Alteromonas sp.]|tara:strand:+ start:23559 stop:26594 length:3036 start_codon:yes stop_codon:yes gene_type:complete